eukprot:357516-Chlamydomonas_euryale.AAC.3
MAVQEEAPACPLAAGLEVILATRWKADPGRTSILSCPASKAAMRPYAHDHVPDVSALCAHAVWGMHVSRPGEQRDRLSCMAIRRCSRRAAGRDAREYGSGNERDRFRKGPPAGATSARMASNVSPRAVKMLAVHQETE